MICLAKADIDGEKGVDDGKHEEVELVLKKCPDRAGFASLLSGRRAGFGEVGFQELFTFLCSENPAAFLGISAVDFGFAGEHHDEL